LLLDMSLLGMPPLPASSMYPTISNKSIWLLSSFFSYISDFIKIHICREAKKNIVRRNLVARFLWPSMPIWLETQMIRNKPEWKRIYCTFGKITYQK
jgi:hypothetical protein